MCCDKLKNDKFYLNCYYIHNLKKMKVFLTVPYKDKDEAKRMGAKWCQEQKKWYTTEKYDWYWGNYRDNT